MAEKHLKHDPVNGHLVFGANGNLVNSCLNILTCQCTAGDADPRTKITVSWTEDAWQASTSYMEKIIIKVTVSAVEYLFIKQNNGANTSGGSAPTWDLTIGNTTTDSGVTWVRIPDDFQRGYFGCLWDNGESKIICPDVYADGHNDFTTGGTKHYRTDNERWRAAPTVGNNLSLFSNWNNKQWLTGTNPDTARKHVSMTLTAESQRTDYGLDGFDTGGRMIKRIRFSHRWKDSYSTIPVYPPCKSTNTNTFHNSVSFPPFSYATSTFMYTTTTAVPCPPVNHPSTSYTYTPGEVNLRTNVKTTASEINITDMKADNQPIPRVTNDLGIINGAFGQVTNVACVTFKWERLSPSQGGTVGTPDYWKRTAP